MRKKVLLKDEGVGCLIGVAALLFHFAWLAALLAGGTWIVVKVLQGAGVL